MIPNLVAPTGLEPATAELKVPCSNHLSYDAERLKTFTVLISLFAFLSSVTLVLYPIRVGLRVTVRTQKSQITDVVVLTVTVDMIHLHGKQFSLPVRNATP